MSTTRSAFEQINARIDDASSRPIAQRGLKKSLSAVPVSNADFDDGANLSFANDSENRSFFRRLRNLRSAVQE